MTLLFLKSYLESIGMPYLQQSCTNVKTEFLIRDKKVFPKTCKVFRPAGIAAVMTSQISFFFLTIGPQGQFIYLEMVGNLKCRYQSTPVHNKQFNFFLYSASGEHFQHHKWHYGVHDVIQGFWYCTKQDEKYARTVSGDFLLPHNLLERLLTWR